MAGILDVLLLAKDGQERFCNPEFNFCNMADFEEGQGYLMKMDEAIDLVWQLGDEEELASSQISPTYLPKLNPTDNNMSLLVLCKDILNGEIGVYSGDQLVGSGVINNGKCSIAVWGDDLTTDELDGAVLGDALNLKLFIDNIEHSAQYNFARGSGSYLTNGFQVMEISDVSSIPEEFGITSTYPNPFNRSTSVTFNLLETGKANLALYDLSGRLVTNLLSG